jgi:hypothetical protein
MPKEIRPSHKHTCEFDCKGCVDSGYNQALYDAHKALEKRLKGVVEVIKNKTITIAKDIIAKKELAYVDDTTFSYRINCQIKYLAHAIRQHILGGEE